MYKLFLRWAIFTFFVSVCWAVAIAFVISGSASNFVLVLVAVSIVSWLIATFSLAKAFKMEIE